MAVLVLALAQALRWTTGYICVCADDFFRPHMESLGYTGIFWPKACSPAEQYGYPCDGCAIFYRAARFDLVGSPQGMSHACVSLQYHCLQAGYTKCSASLKQKCAFQHRVLVHCRTAFCSGRRSEWKARDAASYAQRQASKLRYRRSNHPLESESRPGEKNLNMDSASAGSPPWHHHDLGNS